MQAGTIPKKQRLRWHGRSSARGSRGPHDQLLNLYEELEYLALSPTTMLVQLADSTIRYPEGIAEHVFVRVRDSFILADFVVMDM